MADPRGRESCNVWAPPGEWEAERRLLGACVHVGGVRVSLFAFTPLVSLLLGIRTRLLRRSHHSQDILGFSN